MEIGKLSDSEREVLTKLTEEDLFMGSTTLLLLKMVVALEQETLEYVPIDIKNFQFEVYEKATEEPFNIKRFCEKSNNSQLYYKNHDLAIGEDGDLLLINGAGFTTWLDSSEYYLRLKDK